MSASDGVFNNLRQKLDVLGYTQTLPLAGIPLVGALFEDLVKSTESLRDAKKKIVDLLEEKSCWELGVEPYKCDNSRLLAECNQLHLQALREREDSEQRIAELNQRVRNLVTDKIHLEEHCQELQQQLTTLLAKQQSASSTSVNMKNVRDKSKKPFITTVRSGERLPPLMDNASNIRCTKCSTNYVRARTISGAGAENMQQSNMKIDLEKLENKLKDVTEQVDFYKRKVESRDREVRRLNDLLSGGRPPAALAKDCCFKDVRGLSEDIELLQREKSETLTKLREYQDQMHEAMQRAIDLETRNKQMHKELDELKVAALQVETQANTEIAQREQELEALQKELKKLRAKHDKADASKPSGLRNLQERATGGADVGNTAAVASLTADKRRLNERINELTRHENELKAENEKLQKKIQKFKSKIHTMQKELQDNVQRKEERLDEEKIRIKSERDFFQKEYLRLVSKAGSEKEIDFLQSQIKSKDEELRVLRAELCLRQQEKLPATSVPTANAATATACFAPAGASSARSNHSINSNGSSGSDCVQAVVLRAERERDCARAELERVRCERDTLREKHLFMLHTQAADGQKSQEHIAELNERLRRLERENRDLNSARLPSETQIVLLKEEIDELKRRLFALQEENGKLRTSQNQLKILHEQTERTLLEYQSKLTIAERQLETADTRLNDLDTNRETTQHEAAQLRNEVAALKRTYVSLENEKDKILMQLDAKTERAYQLEYELKSCREKRNSLEQQVKEREEQFNKLNSKTRERDAELHETSTESKSLRQQITALKISRDEAIAENGRLTNELAERQAEILMLKKKLKDSELEIEQLKQQLRQYVQEVKKAEDLLSHKEREREEMLEHYRSLSHDAVVLEGNNQSLEVEAAEYKRQICELETEIKTLKQEICCRNGVIEQMEDKIAVLSSQNTILERQLEEAIDEQRLLKVDLSARKELCDKLDIQKDKLNAELAELNEIKRKLEYDNEQLRTDREKFSSGQKVSSDTLEELLSKTRRDLEEQIKVDSKLSQELVRLRQQNNGLLHDLDAERQRRQQQETLAQEYQIQNQELRHNLTDDRFRQARSREQSPRYPAQTL